MPYLLLEGMADRYEHFLSAAANASLLKISEDFHFEIQTIEGPALLLRHVRTHGQASNDGELGDAFYALMLSYPPGDFSSAEPLAEPGRGSRAPTLHWHLAGRPCINHHRNSRVTFLRLETARLARALSSQAIAVAQLASLQGVEAPAGLVQLIESLGPQLAGVEHRRHPSITEAFLLRLAQELRSLLGPPKASDINAAGHVSRAIEWMMPRLEAPVSLQQLASELAFTPRTLQGCFRSQLDLPPMRWLKLARLSRLRQLLWDPDLTHHSVQQLFGSCGLSDTGLNRLSYREVYGITPRDQRRQADEILRQSHYGEQDTLHRQFDSLAAAIRYLEGRQRIGDLGGDTSLVTITITAAASADSRSL